MRRSPELVEDANGGDWVLDRIFMVSLCLALMLLSTQARGTQISPTDYVTLAPGANVSGPWKTDFLSPEGLDIADLTVSVYLDQATEKYTYELVVDPTDEQTHNISLFGTGSGFPGFTGVAGYSFSQAEAAGASQGARAFWVDYDEDLQALTWVVNFSEISLWTEPAVITFFFQSLYGPGLGDYTLMNSEVGSATNQAPSSFPIPEPPTLMLLGTGALFAAGWRMARSNGSVWLLASGLPGLAGLRKRFQG
ncbi:MAG: PEP-CTERM sorting domain-containing protein [Thermodesulfobacteriota bacterium]